MPVNQLMIFKAIACIVLDTEKEFDCFAKKIKFNCNAYCQIVVQ